MDKINEVLESVGCENLFDDIISLDSVLSTKDRNELPDSAFGIPKLRKYPLKIMKDGKLQYDEVHISKAITYFRKCDPQYKDELARNICKGIKATGMKVSIGEDSPFYPYYKKYCK